MPTLGILLTSLLSGKRYLPTLKGMASQEVTGSPQPPLEWGISSLLDSLELQFLTRPTWMQGDGPGEPGRPSEHDSGPLSGASPGHSEIQTRLPPLSMERGAQSQLKKGPGTPCPRLGKPRRWGAVHSVSKSKCSQGF